MGAEKAIFRHLKTGERPPKHGLIFQHPSVRGAKWWNRGKVARNLALKITPVGTNVGTYNISANFTGDCRLTQAKSVYDQELMQGTRTDGHVLVAPHHGGDYGASFRHYSIPCNDVVISVGNHNSYGHPQKEMLRYLRNLCIGRVRRTDKDGDISIEL